FRQIDESALRIQQLLLNTINLRTQPQAQVCRHLIVAAASRVQLASRVADELHEARFDKGMDIFGRQLVEVPCVSPCALEDRLKSVLDLFRLSVGQNACAAQAFTMRETRAHIRFKQSPIKTERAVELDKSLISFACESPAPQIFRLVHLVLRLITCERIV